MKAIYKQVTKSSYIRAVSALADEIWHECYLRVIPGRPLNALLAQQQSPEAIDDAIHEGSNYFLVQLGGKEVGYFAFYTAPGSVCLDKLYLRKAARGQGLGREIVTYVEKLAEGDARAKVTLSVPKKCLETITFFKHRGYRLSEEELRTLPGGETLPICTMDKLVRF